MMWGCFGASGPVQLVIIEGNMNSAPYQKFPKENVWSSVLCILSLSAFWFKQTLKLGWDTCKAETSQLYTVEMSKFDHVQHAPHDLYFCRRDFRLLYLYYFIPLLIPILSSLFTLAFSAMEKNKPISMEFVCRLWTRVVSWFHSLWEL